MSEEQNKAPEHPAAAPQGEQKPVELTVQDLGVIRSVIDVACLLYTSPSPRDS